MRYKGEKSGQSSESCAILAAPIDPIIMTLTIHRNSYGQAVRTLRAALNGHSKKPYSMFCRSDGDANVSFALRKVITWSSICGYVCGSTLSLSGKGFPVLYNLVGTFS